MFLGALLALVAMHGDPAVHQLPVYRLEDGGVEAQAREVHVVSYARVDASGNDLRYRHAALILEWSITGHAQSAPAPAFTKQSRSMRAM